MADVKLARPVASFLGQCPLVFVIGLALTMAVTVIWEPTDEAIVFGSPERTLAYLDDSNTRIVEITATYLIVYGMERGFVRHLYANGARVVLPASAGGCLSRGTNPL